MQITHCQVTPIQLKRAQPVRLAGSPPVDTIGTIFVRLETRDRRNAWGCGIAHPDLTGEQFDEALRVAHKCAELAPDLHPTNLEYSLAMLAPLVKDHPAVSCAFDLAFYDLLGLAADMPLYRLLGGYRNRIQTSATIPVSTVKASVQAAYEQAQLGFRMLKIKGGEDPKEDVQRVLAIHRALPNHALRLDGDGGYTVREALEVSDALKEALEMLEQPISPGDLESLRQVTKNSSVPILADQSVCGPAAALELATTHAVDGLSIKVAACGGLQQARLVNDIARAAQLVTQVSCLIEPGLLIAAGLSLALSSPNVQFADLDGALGLLNDPTRPGHHLEDGWLVASEIPGLGCSISF